MGAFNAKGLTNKGIALQAKAQAGAQLVYTKFMIGDGTLGTNPIGPLTNLISAKLTLPITGKEMTPPDRATLMMVVDNQNVITGFYWRELGLYAQDPDEGEILYWYGNAGATADFIPAGGGSEIFQEQFALHVFVGTATNVTAIIDTSLIYATVDQVNEALEESKEYTDSAVAGATIPDATLTAKGKVQLSNSTISQSETQAATPKAVSTARQEAILAADTDATTKANTAETNAKNASLPRTGGALTGPIRISSWGEVSASSGGYVLYGHNCYLDATGVVYRYRNTHATMGARGIVFRLGSGLEGAWMFDMGAIATTAGASFTPVLKRLLNTDDYDSLNTQMEQSDLWGAI